MRHACVTGLWKNHRNLFDSERSGSVGSYATEEFKEMGRFDAKSDPFVIRRRRRDRVLKALHAV